MFEALILTYVICLVKPTSSSKIVLKTLLIEIFAKFRAVVYHAPPLLIYIASQHKLDTYIPTYIHPLYTSIHIGCSQWLVLWTITIIECFIATDQKKCSIAITVEYTGMTKRRLWSTTASTGHQEGEGAAGSRQPTFDTEARRTAAIGSSGD